MAHRITDQRDALGRSTGYVYAKNDIPQQQTSIGYGADGRIATAGFTHQGEHEEFLYSYLPGTHQLHTLAHPNGLTLTQSYDATRDLPTQMDYSRADALVVQRAYTYDLLGRPTARNLARYGTETQDSFGYNTRSELTTARVNSADYSYAYDAIGNRTSATEAGTRTAYTANKLNQYTAEGSFRPTFDADGNQTLIRTSTGTWNVTYNAKNRPVLFAKSDGSVTVECTYDTMGRRATKKVTTNGTLTEHRRFLYRGYLQIDSPPPHRRLTPSGQSRFAHCPTGLTAVGRLACCDLTRAYTPALWFITWDPTQPTATRPIAIQKNGTWYTYGWDLTKNICETYRTDGRIDLAYTYTPYGECTPAHSYDQPLRWSSEYHDVELGLVYYNYRHYNPQMGRWIAKDEFPDGKNRYVILGNYPLHQVDRLGYLSMELVRTQSNFFTKEFGIAFGFGWIFSLDHEHNVPVYIVQNIDFCYEVKYDYFESETTVIEKKNYFETWDVPAGSINPTGFAVNGVYAHDYWRYFDKVKAPYARFSAKSLAFVYSEKRTDDINNLWSREIEQRSGGLPATKIEPLWWGQPASGKEKTQQVQLEVEFDECAYETEYRKISIIKNGISIVNYETPKSY